MRGSLTRRFAVRGAVLGVAAVVTYNSAIVAAREALIEYAEGVWRCDLHFATGAEESEHHELTADAVIKASDDNGGDFAVYLTSPIVEGFEVGLLGEWHLDGTDLELALLDHTVSVVEDGSVETFEGDPSHYDVSGATLETHGIEILTVGQSGDPLTVDIARKGDTVEFRWTDEHAEERFAMRCTKA